MSTDCPLRHRNGNRSGDERVKAISNIIPNVTLHASAELRRGRTTRRLELSDFSWQTSRELTATVWRHGQSKQAEAQLWWHLQNDNRAEIVSSITAADGWTLSQWAFEVRIALRRENTVAWPFVGGAFVPVSKLISHARTLELTYPVYASMQWADVFGKNHGIYVGAHDSEPWFKHMRVRAEKTGSKRIAIFEFIYTDLDWPAGKPWQSPPLIIATHPGDWREGAKIYRNWANTWFRHDAIPEWMKRSAGHNMVSFPSAGGRVKFNDLPRLAAETRRLGINGIHVADYMEEGFDTFYPAYKPDPRLGGTPALKRAIRNAEDAGVWTCLYTNGRLNDPAGPNGQHAFEWAAKLPKHVQKRFKEMWARTQDPSYPGWDPSKAVPEKPAPFNLDGTAAQEWWGRILSPMCPSVSAWQQLWLSRLRDLATSLNPLMFQVDQVCGCWSMPCYDKNHPHRSPALAWSGYKEFMWQLRRQIHAINPNVGFWSEGVNDILGQPFDGLQPNTGFESLLAGIGEWDPRLFKYTFPEFALVVGDLTDQKHQAFNWAVMLGSHSHFYLPEPDKLDPDTRRRVMFTVKMRKRYWREFASTNVFIPDAIGDTNVKTFGYRSKHRQLIIAAPLRRTKEPDHRIDIEIPVTGARQIVHSEWMTNTHSARVDLKRNRLRISGQGIVVVLLK